LLPALFASPGGMQPFEPGVQPQPVLLPLLQPGGVPPFCFQFALPWLKPAGIPETDVVDVLAVGDVVLVVGVERASDVGVRVLALGVCAEAVGARVLAVGVCARVVGARVLAVGVRVVPVLAVGVSVAAVGLRNVKSRVPELAVGLCVEAVGVRVLSTAMRVLVVGACAEVVGMRVRSIAVRVLALGVFAEVVGVRVRARVVGTRVATVGVASLRVESCGTLARAVGPLLRVAVSCGVRDDAAIPLAPPALFASPGGMQPFEPGVQPQPVLLPLLQPGGVPPFCFQFALPWLKPAGMALRVATVI